MLLCKWIFFHSSFKSIHFILIVFWALHFCWQPLNLIFLVIHICFHATFEAMSTKSCSLCQSNFRTVGSLWSKIGTFQLSVLLCKSTTTPWPTRYLLTILKSFPLSYWMKFYHKNYERSKLKLPKKTYFIKWIWKAKILTTYLYFWCPLR